MRAFPLVISSPSGGGKTTIKNYLLKLDKTFKFSITCTTREKREHERDGVDYFFLSDEEFNNKIKNGEFLEWAEVHGKKYGTLRKTVENILSENKIPIMTIDVVGAINVKKIFIEALLIFVLPPNLDIMVDRLKRRGDKEFEIKKRMKTALKELEYVSNFDYLLINDKIEDVVKNIYSIVNIHKEKVYFKMELLNDFKVDIEKYLKKFDIKGG